MQSKLDPKYQLAWAWVGLCLALAIHVTDEALTGFLEFYNPTVSAIREQIPFLPIPTFRFDVWIAGLGLGILILFGLSFFVFRKARWMIPTSLILGSLMLLNGAVHISGTLYLGQLMPGVFSSPLLMLAAGFLFFAALKARRSEAKSSKAPKL